MNNKIIETDKLMKKVLLMQKLELTAYYVYQKISQKLKNKKNTEIIEKLAEEELKAYNIWKQITLEEVKPYKFLIFLFTLMSKIFWLTFTIKLLEKVERSRIIDYSRLKEVFPNEIKQLQKMPAHEDFLIKVIDEKYLKFMGSITLWLNDALVELTWALAWFTLAINDNKMIALTGLILWLSASLSMAASEYLATKNEWWDNALQAAYLTGFSYVFTVIVLIFPFFIFNEPFVSILVTLFNAILVILFFTFYLSVVKDYNFKARFWEMVFISLWVAGISFWIGFFVKLLLWVEI